MEHAETPSSLGARFIGVAFPRSLADKGGGAAAASDLWHALITTNPRTRKAVHLAADGRLALVFADPRC